MQVLEFEKAETKKQAPGGLAGWMLSAVSNLRTRKPSERQMVLMERLTLGPKKELLLVRCGEELFLVGTGADSVQTIVPVPSHVVAAPELAL